MLDVGGIAKGWIADRLIQQLVDEGVSGALVNIGGAVSVMGSKPDGSAWKIGLKEPESKFGDERLLATMQLAEGSISSSGIIERGFSHEGAYYHHILDPLTGNPIETPWQSVSVVAKKAIDSEGYSTTLLSMNLKEARDLARDTPEIEQAFFFDHDGRIFLLRDQVES